MLLRMGLEYRLGHWDAGHPELDFSCWDENREAYFAAIHAGLDDYGPMEALVRRVVPAFGPRADGGSSFPPP